MVVAYIRNHRNQWAEHPVNPTLESVHALNDRFGSQAAIGIGLQCVTRITHLQNIDTDGLDRWTLTIDDSAAM